MDEFSFGIGAASMIAIKVAWTILKAGTAYLRERAKTTESKADDAALSVLDSALGDKPPGVIK